MCLSMIGWASLRSEIESQKLSFLGNICNMPDNLLVKKIFNARLSVYICRTDDRQLGFIPDIVTTLMKYGLSRFIIQYVQTGCFPSKQNWKSLYKCSITNIETNLWYNRLQADDDFIRFRLLHTNIERAIIWSCATDSESLNHAHIVSKLWLSNDSNDNLNSKCNFCGTIFQNSLKHMLFQCSRTEHLRCIFYNNIHATFGANVTEELLYGDFERQL
jgi:hypothetical protein